MTDLAWPTDGPSHEVAVVAALSLSALNHAELDGAALPRDPEALVTLLSDPERRSQVVAWITRHRPATASSELTALPAIIDRYENGTVVALHLLLDGNDPLHGPVIELLTELVDTLPALRGRVRIVPVPVDAEFTTVAGAVGAGTTVPNALAGLVARHRDVWVNATSSVRSLSIQAVALAGVAGWRVFIIPDHSKAEIHTLDLRAIGPDRASVMAVLDDDDLRGVLDAFIPDVLDAPSTPSHLDGSGAPRLGASLRSYYETLAFSLPDRPVHAATAAVLERFSQTGRPGAIQAAAVTTALSECVRRWVDQRLWSLNLIPEIVVHDDRHVERVDGFAAMMIAPMLHDGAMSPSDAAAVSAAAWLHDWGHVGSRLGSGYVSHPIAVRYLHGLLSQQLIRDAPSMHGLEQLGPEVPALVGVLCAHHQRWCSCSAEPVLTSAQRTVLELFSDRPEVIAPSLHEAAEQLGVDPERLELLVSVLRVADAADIGAHRVPDYGSGRLEFLANCARRELSRTEAHLHQLDIGSDLRRDLVEWVHSVVAGISDDITRTAHDPAPDLDGASAFVRGAVTLVEEYLRVLANRTHDDLHRSVQLVRFRVDLSPGGGVVVLPQVLTAADVSTDADPAVGVSTALRNELECVTSSGTVRDTLRNAGTQVSDATSA